MKISRRAFLGTTVPFALGGCRSLFTVGYAAPHRPPASERINLGIIGCGTQAYGNVAQFLQDPRVQIVVTCDPVLEAPGYSYKAQMPGGRLVFKRKVDERYGNASCRMEED